MDPNRQIPENNYNLVRLLSQMFTNNGPHHQHPHPHQHPSPNLPRLHLPVDSQIGLPPQLFSMTFSGYSDEISAVVSKTFDNSPRTADSVRTILTPRYIPQQDFPTSSYYTNSSTLSSSGSTWPHFTSSAPEVTFSDLSLNFPKTPRFSKSDRSYRMTPRTPKSDRYGVELSRIPESNGSELTRDELRNFKLNERPLPTPRTHMPGRRENGIHIPYLDLPASSRSGTLVNMNELLTSLLSSYKSSTGAQTKVPSGIPGNGNVHNAPTKIQATAAGVSNSQTEDKKWTKRDKMFLAGLVCLAILILLLVIIVILVAIGVNKDDDSNDSSTRLSQVPGASLTTRLQGNGTVTRPPQIPTSSIPLSSNNQTINNNNSSIANSTVSPPSMINSSSARTSNPTSIITVVSGGVTMINSKPTTSRTTSIRPSNINNQATTTKTSSTITTTSSPTNVLVLIDNSASSTPPPSPSPPASTPAATTTTSTTLSNIIADNPSTLQTTTTTKQNTNPAAGIIIPNLPTNQENRLTDITSTTSSPSSLSSSSTVPTTIRVITQPPTTPTTTTTTTITTTTTETTTTENPLAALVGEQCLTGRCQEFADLITSSQNTSADPCFEFYEYSCGDMDQSSLSFAQAGTTPLQQLVTQDLHKIAANVLTSGAADHLVGTVFRSCLDSNTDQDVDRANSELQIKFQDIVLTAESVPTLSLDLLMRRILDNFGTTPFISIHKIPQFDGLAYNYVTRITPPPPIFHVKEYSNSLQEYIEVASGYIETVANFLDFIVNESVNRRQKRSPSDGLGQDNLKKDIQSRPGSGRANNEQDVQPERLGVRHRRQTVLTKDEVKAKVQQVFDLDWQLAQILPGANTPVEDLVVRNVKLRALRSRARSIPWTLLTELNVIDDVQVQSLQYLEDLQSLLSSTEEDLVKLYVYVRTLVDLFPYLPGAMRAGLDYTGTGIQQAYTSVDCSGLAFKLLPEDGVNLVTEGQRLQTNQQWATAVAESAKSDVQRAIGSFRGIDTGVKQAILSDLSSLRVTLSYPVDNPVNITFTTSPSLLSVAMEILEQRVVHLRTVSQGSAVNVKEVLYTDLEPVVNTGDNTVELPLSFVHLSDWLKDVDFLMPFYKSLMFRSLMEYVTIKYMYSPSFSTLQNCWLQPFQFLQERQSTEAEIAILVEAAVMELIYAENRLVLPTSVVQIGNSYFYERQLVYLANAQPQCMLQSPTAAMLDWSGSIRPDVFLSSIFAKHYRGGRSFDCTQPSCFYWSQALVSGEGGGE